MSERIQTGTLQAHGRTWPLYQRAAFQVEVIGTVDAASGDDAEALAGALRDVLDKHGVEVRVKPVSVSEMSAEDQAEKNALDEAARR
jgi:hypothetical protein